MLIEETQILVLLRRIVAGFTADSVLQADLMQECLFHLWKIEREKPGQTRSWYLQSCRFHLQHYLTSGRSLDSHKRANGTVLKHELAEATIARVWRGMRKNFVARKG